MLQKFTKTLFLTVCVLLSQSAFSQTVPLDFESQYTSPMNLFGFGGTTGSVIANPDMSGDNTSATVLQMNKEQDAQTWAGVAMPIATKIDFSGGNEMTMKVWAAAPGTMFQIKLEDTNSPPDGNGNPSVFAEVAVAAAGGSAWETLTFDMTAHPDFDATFSYDQIVVFADFGNVGPMGGVDFFVDDIMNPTSGPLAPFMPVDFESPAITHAVFGFGASDFGPIPAALVANPDASGENTSATVLEIIKPVGAQTWAGASMDIGAPIDFSSTNVITLKFWSAFAGIPVQLKIEDADSPLDANGNPTVFAEVVVNSTADVAWETLSFDMSTFAGFDAAVEYERLVFFPDFGNTPFISDIPFYFDDIQMEMQVAPMGPVLPLDLEDPTLGYNPSAFGGNPDSTRITANPDMSGENTSATVWHIHKSENAVDWAGAFIDLAEPIDFSSSTTLSMKVWAPDAGTAFRLKVENAADGSIIAEVEQSTVGGGAWETLTFNMAEWAGFDLANTYNRVVVFPSLAPGVAGGTDYYVDDIQLSAPVVTLPSIPIGFESTTLTYTLFPFGNNTAAVIANPDASGENTSATVLEIFKPEDAETWAGVAIPLQNTVDLSGGGVFSMKVWSPDAGVPFLLKMEDTTSPPDANGNPSVIAEVFVNTTVAGAWETLVFDLNTFAGYDPASNFNQIVIFANMNNPGNPGGTTYYVDDIQAVAPVVTLPSIPIGFESTSLTYTLFPFGNNTSQVIANPDPSGENTSATVLEIFKPEDAETWAGVAIPLENIVDLSAGGVFSMKVWSPNAGVPFMLKMEDTTSPPDANGNPSIISEVIVNTTVASAWETLVFDMTTFAGYDPSHQYNQIVIFANMNNPGNPGGTTYYVDDIQANTVVAVTLPDIPVDFEQAGAGITYQTFGFDGVEPSIITNPDMSGVNVSANVLQLTKLTTAQVWGGVAIPLENPIDLNTSTGSKFSIAVWSPRVGVPFLLKFEDLTDPMAINVELSQTTTVANAWETLVFDMSTGTGWDASAEYDQVVIFPDFGNDGLGENFYVDDIMHALPTSISKVDLEKVKVNAFPNPVDEVLNLQISIPVSGQLTVDVIDVLGRNVNQLNLGTLTAGNYTDELNVSTLNTGTYFMVTRLDGTIISTKNIFVK